MELESREGMGRKRRQGTVLAGITAVVMILGTCILVALSGDFGFEEEVKLLPATFRSGPRAGEPWGEESAGSRKLLMISTSLMVAGLGDGLFSLIVLYMILLLTVRTRPLPETMSINDSDHPAASVPSAPCGWRFALIMHRSVCSKQEICLTLIL